MAIDPRYVTTGVQLGRSLAPQRPPIQETMALDMQRNQQIMEVMKELLKAHQSDISDMRKNQMLYYYKAWTDPNITTPDETKWPTDSAYREYLAGKIAAWKPGSQGMFNQFINGPQGLDLGEGEGGAQGFLNPDRNIATAEIENPPAGRPNAAPRIKPAPAAPADTVTVRGRTYKVGDLYNGYKYIGKDQWQKIF